MKIEQLGNKLTESQIQEQYKLLKKSFPSTFVEPQDLSSSSFRAEYKKGLDMIDAETVDFHKEYGHIGLSDFTVFYNSGIATVNSQLETPYNQLEKELLYRIYRFNTPSKISELVDSISDPYLRELANLSRNSTEYGRPKEMDLYDSRKEDREGQNQEFREQLKMELMSLGYHVSKSGHNGDLYDSTGSKIEHATSEESALWLELKKNTTTTEKNLQSLLNPILKNSNNELHTFTLYNPSLDYNKEAFNAELAYNQYTGLMMIPERHVVSTLAKQIKDSNSNQAIALSSILNGVANQYLQIDFETKDFNEVKKTLQELNINGGNIVNSGNSFHYHNFETQMTQQEWHNQMEKLKDFDSIGKFWPKFQQKQGFSMLRIAPSSGKEFFPEHVNTQPIFEKIKITFDGKRI